MSRSACLSSRRSSRCRCAGRRTARGRTPAARAARLPAGSPREPRARPPVLSAPPPGPVPMMARPGSPDPGRSPRCPAPPDRGWSPHGARSERAGPPRTASWPARPDGQPDRPDPSTSRRSASEGTDSCALNAPASWPASNLARRSRAALTICSSSISVQGYGRGLIADVATCRPGQRACRSPPPDQRIRVRPGRAPPGWIHRRRRSTRSPLPDTRRESRR